MYIDTEGTFRPQRLMQIAERCARRLLGRRSAAGRRTLCRCVRACTRATAWARGQVRAQPQRRAGQRGVRARAQHGPPGPAAHRGRVHDVRRTLRADRGRQRHRAVPRGVRRARGAGGAPEQPGPLPARAAALGRRVRLRRGRHQPGARRFQASSKQQRALLQRSGARCSRTMLRQGLVIVLDQSWPMTPSLCTRPGGGQPRRRQHVCGPEPQAHRRQHHGARVHDALVAEEGARREPHLQDRQLAVAPGARRHVCDRSRGRL